MQTWNSPKTQADQTQDKEVKSSNKKSKKEDNSST